MNADRQKKFKAIIDRYGDNIYRIALLHTRNKMDAQDIVQEVFLKYAKSEKNFDSDEHIKAWLIRVTINMCIDLRKSAWSSRVSELNDNIIADDETGGDESGLQSAVMKLPEKYINIIHLFYYEDYSIKEIADITNQNEGTIKMQLSRARGLLKKILKGDQDYAF